MPLPIAHLNWIMVGLAALAAFMLGAIWYGALFGKAWRNAHALTPEQMTAMQARRPMPIYFGLLIMCYLIASIALGTLTVWINVQGAVAGATIGAVVWALVAAFRLTAHVSSPKPFAAYVIDAGFDLIAVLTMCIILVSFR